MDAQKLMVELSDSSSSGSEIESSEHGSPPRRSKQLSPTPKRLKMTPELVSALDRSNISDRRAVMLVQLLLAKHRFLGAPFVETELKVDIPRQLP